MPPSWCFCVKATFGGFVLTKRILACPPVVFGVSVSCCVLFAGPPAENNLDSSSLLKHFQVGVFFFLLVQVDGSRCWVLLLRSTFQIPPIFQAGQSNAFASTALAALLYLPEKIHTFLNKSGNTVPINWMSRCYFLLDTQAARDHWWGNIFRTVAGYRTISCH